MAHFSDGGPHISMPDFSDSGPSNADIKFHLQSLLDSKEKQLQQAGTLGQRVLAQQMELEERIRQLQEETADGDEGVLDEEAKARYRELAETIEEWDKENAMLSNAFGNKRQQNGMQLSPLQAPIDLPTHEPESRSKAGAASGAAQSRRAKNAAHRADDVEFAFEIGSGLLTEVRRLQSLLGERDKAIQDMKEEKDDLEKSVESLRTALRTQEQSSDKFKEENWNLEVTLQELRTQLADSQSTASRLESDYKRLTKALNNSLATAETQKTEAQALTTQLAELKAKNETDVAQARKIQAGLMREKSDLQGDIDKMKAEVARASRRLGGRGMGSPLTPGHVGDGKDFLTPAHEEAEDVFGIGTTGGMSTNRRRGDGTSLLPYDEFGPETEDSPDPSPSKSFNRNAPGNELEVLKERLAHAQRQINTLKGTLKREKELRIGYGRRLDESSTAEDLTFEQARETDGDYEDAEVSAERRPTPYKRGRGGRGGGRGKGGMTLIQRMGLAAQSPASEYDDDRHTALRGGDIPPVPSIPVRFQDSDDDEDLTPQEPVGPEIEEQDDFLDTPENRTSVDGMDPAFANILRKTSTSSPHGASPLRQSVTAGRGARKSRGGMAYQEPRPSSLVGQPEALAAELGAGFGKELAEMGTQTDFVEPPAVQVIPAVPVNEIAVQAEDVTPLQKALTIDTSEAASQTPSPVFVSASTITDPDVGQTPIEAAEEVKVVDDSGTGMSYTQRGWSRSSIGSTVPGDTTITRMTRAFIGDGDDEGDQTETGAGTETETDTDGEGYVDAPQSVFGTTPSASRDDFHSVMTVSDREFDSESDDSDVDSMRRNMLVVRDVPSSQVPEPRVVEKIVEVPIEKIVEKVIEVPVDRVVEKIVEVPVEKIVEVEKIVDREVPVEKIVERIVEVPVEKIVEKFVDREVPVEKIVERIVEVPVEKIVEKRVEVPVDRIVDRIIKVPAKNDVPPPPPKPTVQEMSTQTEEWNSAPTMPFGFHRVGSTAQQFQFVSPPPSTGPGTTSLLVNAPSPKVARDSSATFGNIVRPRTAQSDRQSIDSAVSSILDDNIPKSRVTSPAVDRSKPPMMAVPPPPRQPPPPGSMPPPQFVPDRRPTYSDAPPPRPSSPPPPELIQRATTPMGSVLSVPGRPGYLGRQHGASMPPSQTQQLHQLPSTSSFRSAANIGSYTQQQSDRAMASPRSSISSDHQLFTGRSRNLPTAPATPGRDLEGDRPGLSTGGGSTDPATIHAITQTMIGEFLYKYTRRTIGKGHGQTRHKRFFWVHPYTKTLYWSNADPGSSNVHESSAKSAYIEGVRSVLDPNPMPPGLYQYSVIICTAQREMKITAPTKERHDIWLNALKYLLARPSSMAVTSPGDTTVMPTSPMSVGELGPPVTPSPQSQRSVRSAHPNQSWSTTPRGQKSRSQLSIIGSVGKRSGTPAAEYMRWNGPESPYSPSKSFEHVGAEPDADDLDFELHGGGVSDDGFEGLENVRACCDGLHTVGHQHHHFHPQDQAQNGDHQHHLDIHPSENARPASPAWSFRSRAGSTTSQDGNGIFGGKLRFGSRRSTKAIPTVANGQ